MDEFNANAILRALLNLQKLIVISELHRIGEYDDAKYRKFLKDLANLMNPDDSQ